ncbi:MAG: hypothetical protein Q7T86_13235 [Hyphomicrobiaceae bacterium]|nr:hypothetical protein [Hyphomicrobiaceae bacterium]
MTNDKRKAAEEKELDDALEHTFPASDPISLNEDTSGEGARIDRAPAKLDQNLVERLSREVKARVDKKRADKTSPV